MAGTARENGDSRRCDAAMLAYSRRAFDGHVAGSQTLVASRCVSSQDAAANRLPCRFLKTACIAPCKCPIIFSSTDAGWSSLAARRAHNPKVVGSNPTPATKPSNRHPSRTLNPLRRVFCCPRKTRPAFFLPALFQDVDHGNRGIYLAAVDDPIAAIPTTDSPRATHARKRNSIS
jgi:hypothetical protein